MTSQVWILLGKLLGPAFASGLNLYATVAAIGIASRLGWVTGLPPALRGLEDALVIASAAGLYAVELAIARVRYLDSVWQTVHTLIRPTAAALLAFAALNPTSLGIQLAGAGLAGVVALAAHGMRAGLRMAINAAPARDVPGAAASTRPDPLGSIRFALRGRFPRLVITLLADAAAGALALAPLLSPAAALAIAGGTITLVALVGPRLWRAFILGLRALTARLRGFFGTARWHEVDAIPADLRRLLEPPAVGLAPPRATRAALYGVRGVGAYRNGWLVLTPDTTVFLYRSFFRARRITLSPSRPIHLHPGPWADTVELDANESRSTLFLLKDGPPSELARADLAAGPP